MFIKNILIIFLCVAFSTVFASAQERASVKAIPKYEENQMNEIVIYTRKICPYCDRAKDLMSKKGWSYTEIDLDVNPDKIKEMLELAKRRSVPQIFINGQHVGGCDDLYDLDAKDQLDKFFS